MDNRFMIDAAGKIAIDSFGEIIINDKRLSETLQEIVGLGSVEAEGYKSIELCGRFSLNIAFVIPDTTVKGKLAGNHVKLR